MADIIRKDGAKVTAFQDAVAFDFAFNGQDGIIKGIGEECAIDTTVQNKVTIKSGMAVIQGRQIALTGNDTVFLQVPIGSVSYYVLIYLEINMATNIATVKKLEYTNAYPELPASDDLKVQPDGTAYMGLYKFINSTSGVNSVEQIAKDLIADSILKQLNANTALIKTKRPLPTPKVIFTGQWKKGEKKNIVIKAGYRYQINDSLVSIAYSAGDGETSGVVFEDIVGVTIPSSLGHEDVQYSARTYMLICKNGMTEYQGCGWDFQAQAGTEANIRTYTSIKNITKIVEIDKVF